VNLQIQTENIHKNIFDVTNLNLDSVGYGRNQHMGIVENNTGIGENQTVSFPVIICYSSAPAQNSLMALRRFFPGYRFAANIKFVS
jgi:hypothetical protein